MCTMTLERHDKPIPCARALYPFQGQSDVELSFDAGVSIQLLRRVDENWLEGRLNGKIGIFPGNHVRVELGSPSLSHESNLAGSGKPLGIALNDFRGDCAGDLQLKKGDLVELMGSAGNGWMRGRLKGEEGIFPTSFVEVLQPRRSASRSAPPTSNQQPYAPVPLPRTKKLSSTEQKLSSLTANLEIERKMLESAEKLAKICSSEKLQMLETEVSTHRETIQRLQQQIVDTETEKSRLVEVQTSVAPSLPSLPPNKVNKAQAMEELLRNVKKEMIETEKDFYGQMDLLATRFLPLVKQMDGSNVDTLLASISDIKLISGDLLRSLEMEETIATSFLSVVPRLKDTYGTYCRNHDSCIANLEKLLEDPNVSVSIATQMGATSTESLSWELQSLLIKPVQRVLKYPLLLEKLLKATPQPHPEHRKLVQALETAQQVAQHINEIKRRKDLVERYTSGDTQKRPSVNMHSLQKKVRRLGQSIRQMTGLRTKTIDTKFDDLEHKMVAMETLVTTLLRDTQEWQDSVKELPRCLRVFHEGMQLYCNTSKVLTDYTLYVTEMQQLAMDHVDFVDKQVIAPLRSLVVLFQNPLHLITKRHDKLLDYDHLQHSLEKAEDHERITLLREECLLAKRTYDALNTQLLDDLPHFLETCTSLVALTLSAFLQGQYSFHDTICGVLGPVAFDTKSDLSSVTTGDLKDGHASELSVACKRLAQLSITPASLLMTGGITKSAPTVNSPEYEEIKDAGSKQASEPLELREGLQCEAGSKLLALFDFEAQTEAELGLSEGEVVILIVPHDKVGSSDWWLVESELDHHKAGYVPASYLTLLENNYSVPPEEDEEEGGPT